MSSRRTYISKRSKGNVVMHTRLDRQEFRSTLARALMLIVTLANEEDQRQRREMSDRNRANAKLRLVADDERAS